MLHLENRLSISSLPAETYFKNLAQCQKKGNLLGIEDNLLCFMMPLLEFWVIV